MERKPFEFSDDDLQLPELQINDPSDELPEEKYEIFRWAQYDWSKFSPSEFGYDVIRLGADGSTRHKCSALSGVYFTIVLPQRKKYLTADDSKRWYPLPRYRDDELIHLAAYRSEGPRKGKSAVLMHRRIMSLTTRRKSETVDHINGYSLDNRDFNLRPATFRLNMHNRAPAENSTGLLPWVEYRNNAETMVGGVFMVDNQKRRSSKTWPVSQQQLAQDWVIAERKKLYGSIPWIGQNAPELPKFPPLIRTSVDLIGMDIPF